MMKTIISNNFIILNVNKEYYNLFYVKNFNLRYKSI